MTRIFDEQGTATPVTVIAAPKQVVTQVKNRAIQIGCETTKKPVKKAQAGHLKDLPMVSVMRDFKITDDQTFDRGDSWDAGVFEKGEKVTVTGTAKGRGFQGVVKRHGFHGSPKTHGHKDQLRMPGSIASRTQGPVAKGKKMGGHMGTNRVSVHNISVVDINTEAGLLYLKGAIPGARGSLVLVKGPGEMTITKKTDQKAEVKEKDTEVVEEKTEQEPVVEVAEEVKEEKSAVTEAAEKKVDEATPEKTEEPKA